MMFGIGTSIVKLRVPFVEESVEEKMLYAFKAELGNSQTAVNNTYSLAQFSSEIYDYGSYYDNSDSNYKWTPPEGLVILTFMAECSNTNANGFLISIYKNGSEIGRSMCRDADSSNNKSIALAVSDVADGDDYYQAYIWRNDGTGQINAQPGGSVFSGLWLGEVE